MQVKNITKCDFLSKCEKLCKNIKWGYPIKKAPRRVHKTGEKRVFNYIDVLQTIL